MAGGCEGGGHLCVCPVTLESCQQGMGPRALKMLRIWRWPNILGNVSTPDLPFSPKRPASTIAVSPHWLRPRAEQQTQKLGEGKNQTEHLHV